MKVRIFQGSADGIEKRVNVWLKRESKITVVFVAQSGTDHFHTLSIWYVKRDSRNYRER